MGEGAAGDAGVDAAGGTDVADGRGDTLGPLAWLLGGAGLLAVVALTFRYTHVPDDSYIFYRYARNIANGDGWVYNPGDASGNGATSPGWTALLAVVALFTDQLRAAGSVLSAIFLVVAALFTVKSLDELGHRLEGVVAAVMIVILPILVGVRGMESPMFLALAAMVLQFGLVRPRPVAAGICGGLVTLARPEGAMLAVIVAVVRWRRDGKFPLAMAAAGVASLVPWVVFSLATLGSPISGTLAAKIAQERSGFFSDGYSSIFGKHYLFIRHVGQMIVARWSLVLLILAAAGFVIVIRRARHDYFIGLIGYVVLHVVAYGLIIRPPAYPWYYSMEYFGLVVLASFAVSAAAQWVASVSVAPGREPLVRAAVAVVVIALFAALCFSGFRREDRYEGYRAAGVYLRDNVRAKDRVAATEIGVLGYVSNRPIVDYMGLLDTRSADELRRRDVTTWFLRERPEYYVAHVPIWRLEAPSASRAEFTEEYTPVFETENTNWSRVRIYRKVGPAERPGGRSPLLTDRLVAAFADAGVELDADDQKVIGLVLAQFVASPELQAEFDTPDGVDMAGLLANLADPKSEDAVADRKALASLADRLDERGLVVTLAPRADEIRP